MSAPTRYRQRSAHGQPAETNPIARTCRVCHASFLRLEFGTDERGIWQDWAWYCSVECAHRAGVETP